MSQYMRFMQVVKFMHCSVDAFLDMWEIGAIDGHYIEGGIYFQRHEVINLKLDIMKRSNEVIK